MGFFAIPNLTNSVTPIGHGVVGKVVRSNRSQKSMSLSQIDCLSCAAPQSKLTEIEGSNRRNLQIVPSILSIFCGATEENTQVVKSQCKLVAHFGIRRISTRALATFLALAGVWVHGEFDAPQCQAIAQGKAPGEPTSASFVDVKNARVMLMDRVTLASPRAGVLAFVEPQEGHLVEAKQIVASLDASVAKVNLAVARLKANSTVERRFSKNLLDLSQIEYDKAKQANNSVGGSGVFTDIDLQRLKLNVDKAALQLEQADSEARVNALTVDQLTAELNSYAVVSSFAGRVTRVHRSKGETVALGDPILEIVAIDRVRIEGYVGIQDGLRVRAGSPVVVRLDLPDVELAEEKVELTGKLVFVDVGVEPVSGQIRVWAEVENPNEILRAGLPAKMTILDSRRPVGK